MIILRNKPISNRFVNIDAILLSTAICGHRGWERFENINIWHLEETITLLILDPRKEKTEKVVFISTEIGF